jgi:hypothetical protein
MRRTALQVLAGAGLLALTLATASAARASGDVVVSVSPTSVAVGQPIEVLVRTFRVVDRGDLSLPFEKPLEPYPVPSNVWNILYPWLDYPFRVVAEHQDGSRVDVPIVRDASDATLWRGATILTKPGAWTIKVLNAESGLPGATPAPGSTSTVTVRTGPSAGTASSAPINPPSTTTAATSIEAGPAALIGALVGFVVGAVLARGLRQRPAL